MSFRDEIAEAICNAHCGDIEAWEITYGKGRDHWRHVADAALAAIATFNASYADPPPRCAQCLELTSDDGTHKRTGKIKCG